MTNYSLSIREHNVSAHLDIENDIQSKRNGLFTFTLRVNNSNIVDYNLTEYVSVPEKYAIIKTIVITELNFTPSNRIGSEPNSVRDDNF